MLIHLTPYLGVLAVLVVPRAALTEVEQLEQKVEQLQESVEQLIQQVRLQQLYVEERTRSEGVSGLKQARVVTQGTKPYFATSVTVPHVAAIHSHANTNDTIGMGEFIAVLNGVEFRTRHNDYLIVQPEEIRGDANRIGYNSVRPITYPEVPPEVTNKTTLQEQIAEMREWFKAWTDQNYTVRDYRKYFKPILCYLEGGWTFSDRNTIDEPFLSNRHHLDAESWNELVDKIIFTSNSGKKAGLENYAYLPTSYFSTGNGTTIGQWNYRILCHPLKNDLPLEKLEVVDDVAARMAFGYTLKEHEKTRTARFKLTEDKRDQFTHFTLLDKLMGEIPGKDGYGNTLTDETLEGDMIKDYVTQTPQKAGYYNRMFKAKRDAMRSNAQYRTFSGETTFMALTTQDKIIPTGYEKCEGAFRRCTTFSQRWTYAIPLEIIYLTPLHTWNPYDIEYKGDFRSEHGESVKGVNNKRSGKRPSRPFNGTNSILHYMTPSEFFDQGSRYGIGDTGTSGKYVLNRNGTTHHTVASGVHIHLPKINGLGELRTRYPVMPFYCEGSPAWKELASLRDMIMDYKAHSRMFRSTPNFALHDDALPDDALKDDALPDDALPDDAPPDDALKDEALSDDALPDDALPDDASQDDTLQDDTLQDDARQDDGTPGNPFQRHTTVTIVLRGAEHQHLILITSGDLEDLRKNPGRTLKVTTTLANGHTHDLLIMARTKTRLRYTECDGLPRCWDDHPISLTVKVF